jgi:hypothetical protein
MRAFVRALSAILVAAPALLLPATAWAQDRRVVTTDGADYFGSDYDVRRDVELNACEAACVGDNQCQAFTYNPAAKWCFLKNGVGELGQLKAPSPDASSRRPRSSRTSRPRGSANLTTCRKPTWTKPAVSSAGSARRQPQKA